MMERAPIVARCSALPDYTDCNRRGAARMFAPMLFTLGYQLKPTRTNAGAIVGSGVHAGGAAMLEEKAKTGELPPQSVVEDAAITELRCRAEEGVDYDNLTLNLLDAEKQVVRMTKVYRLQVAPQVNPLLVEKRFEANVPFTVQQIILSGQLDVLAREPGRLRDSKTGRKLGIYRSQLGGYSMLSKSQPDMLQVNDCVIDFIPRVPVRAEQPPAQTFRQDLVGCESAAIAVLRLIDMQLTLFREGDPLRGIEPGDPHAFPANPSSRLCSDKFCPAYATEWCREHDKGILE